MAFKNRQRGEYEEPSSKFTPARLTPMNDEDKIIQRPVRYNTSPPLPNDVSNNIANDPFDNLRSLYGEDEDNESDSDSDSSSNSESEATLIEGSTSSSDETHFVQGYSSLERRNEELRSSISTSKGSSDSHLGSGGMKFVPRIYCVHDGTTIYETNEGNLISLDVSNGGMGTTPNNFLQRYTTNRIECEDDECTIKGSLKGSCDDCIIETLEIGQCVRVGEKSYCRLSECIPVMIQNNEFGPNKEADIISIKGPPRSQLSEYHELGREETFCINIRESSTDLIKTVCLAQDKQVRGQSCQ